MALADFPLLSDCRIDVLRRIDQPEDDVGQLTWDPDVELNLAFRAEFRYLWERISSLDRSWGIKVSTATITAGNRVVTLPTDLRKVRQVWFLSGTDEDIAHESGSWELIGQQDYLFKFRPDLRELYYLKDPLRGGTLRIVYYYTPPDLVHGILRGYAGNDALLGTYETTEDDRVNDRTMYLYEGTGAGTNQAINDYTGATRTATFATALSPTPDTTTRYTSRPELPWSAYDAFVYGVCSRLLEKLEDERWRIFESRREKHLQDLKTDVMQLDMVRPLQTLDDQDADHIGGYLW